MNTLIQNLKNSKLFSFNRMGLIAIVFSALYVLSSNLSFGAITTTTGSGLWATSGNWSSGVPNATGNATINKVMTLTGQTLAPGSSSTYFFNSIVTSSPSSNKLNIQNGSSYVEFRANAVISGTGTVMTVGNNANASDDGTLNIRTGASVTIIGNVLFNKSSTVLIEPGGELIIIGSLTNSTLSNNVTVNGYLSATGSITNSSNGVVVGTGSITAPTINNSGGGSSIFGTTSSCGSNCSFSPAPPSCTGSTATATSSQTVCSGSQPSSFNASVTLPTTATGVSFQWQTFSNGAWAAASGTNNNSSGGSGSFTSTYQAPAITASSSYKLVVTFTGCSGTESNQLAMSIGVAGPSGTPAISGTSSSLCIAGSSSLTASLGGASSYTWSVPSGLTITSGQGTSVLGFSIQSGFVSGRSITVTGSNSCGAGTSKGTQTIILSNNWSGATNTDWNNTGNWCSGSVPGVSINVLVNSAIILTTSGLNVNNITISGSGTLTLQNSASLNIYGNYLNNGSFASSSLASVNFNGASLQSVGGTTNSSFYNLNLNSASGISLLSAQTVYGSINFVNANADLASNGYLILGSNATGTGRVGTLLSGNTITGSVTVQNYMGAKINARLLSSAVQNAPISQLQTDIWVTGNGTGFDSPSYIPTVYTYVESVSGSTNFGKTRATSTSQTFNVGQGYEVLVRSRSILSVETRANRSTPAVTISVSGTLNQGNVTFPMTYTNSSNATADGWNLLGNPYPSQIDWNASSGWTKTNISSSIYLLDPGSSLTSTTNLQGQVYTYNPSTGCIPAVSGCSGVIAQGQGFYVKATAAGANLSATESVKTSTTGRRNFREEAPQSLDLVRVMVQSTNGLIDETIVRIGEGFTDSLQSSDDDIMKFQNATLNFCTRSAEGVSLVMNSISLNDSTDKVVPLEFVSKQAGEYSLNVNTNSLSKGVADVYLKDNKLGTETKVNGLDTVYFTHDLTDTTTKLRFSLVLRKAKVVVVEDTTSSTTLTGVGKTEDSTAVTGIRESLQMNVSIYPNPMVDNSLTIAMTNSPSATRIGIYNFMGEEVYGQTVTASEVTITDLNLTVGTYFVKITMKDGSSVVKKVVKL